MKNILIVDDEESILEITGKLLAKHGYKALTAKNGKDAYKLLEKHKIDVVLLDLILPDINGLDILKTMKKEYPCMEIIIISGWGSYQDVVNLIKEGAYDYISKPFDNEALLIKVSKALEQKETNKRIKYLDKQYNDIKVLKEYNESIINNMNLGILSINHHNKINIINPFAEKILKLRTSQIQDKDVLKVLKNIFNEYDKMETLYKQLKEHNELFDVLFLNNILGADEQKYHFRVSGCQFSEGILIFITDITEEYNLKQRFIHAERMSTIGQFISSITHGLGNNMANIIANASGVLDETDSMKEHIDQLMTELNPDKKEIKVKMINEKIKENHKRIKDYSDRLLKRTGEMSTNVQSLLNYGRVRQQEINKSPGNINTLIEEAINILKCHNHKNIEWITDLDRSMSLINLNSYQMRDVIIDLALNGMQAMDKGGVLEFKTYFNEKKKCVHISIADSGPGIPEEIHDKIFAAFFTTKKNGTGLGLANVMTTVKNHNGNISFKTKKGKGTVFYIELPI